MREASARARILLADDQPERAAEIAAALQERWSGEVIPVDDIASAETAVEASLAKDGPYQAVLIAHAFAGSDHRFLFSKWCSSPDTIGVLVVPRPIEFDFKLLEFPIRAVVVVPPDVRRTDPQLVAQLGVFMGLPLRNPPRLENEQGFAPNVRVLVQEIDPDLDFSRGRDTLQRLVGLLTPPEVQDFSLYPLTQGGSGAKVFRITHNGSGGTRPFEHVLKLIPVRDRFKAFNELERYQEIRQGLQRTVVPMIPEVRGIPCDPGQRPQPATFGGWMAVLYHYLGAGSLMLADFEQAFLQPKACLRKLRGALATLRVRPTWRGFPRSFLDLLFGHFEPWYASNARVQERSLWDPQDAAPQGVLTFPPYHFRPWEKARIIQSLYVLDPLGRPLLGDRWRQGCDSLLNCLSSQPDFGKSRSQMLTPQRVLLTPVHGDLNANNVLVALNHWAPFLIDFACYQSQGHMVQDLVRLETSIKFELMGREARNAAEGLDLSARRLPGWCAGEDWLNAWPSDDDELENTLPCDRFARLAYALCRYLRAQGRKVHDRLAGAASPGGPSSDFQLSYTAALLYHTLRTVRYESLSPLKRVLAVYSVGKIVERLTRG